jgi:hypothetical protein
MGLGGDNLFQVLPFQLLTKSFIDLEVNWLSGVLLCPPTQVFHLLSNQNVPTSATPSTSQYLKIQEPAFPILFASHLLSLPFCSHPKSQLLPNHSKCSGVKCSLWFKHCDRPSGKWIPSGLALSHIPVCQRSNCTFTVKGQILHKPASFTVFHLAAATPALLWFHTYSVKISVQLRATYLGIVNPGFHNPIPLHFNTIYSEEFVFYSMVDCLLDKRK